MPTVWGGGYIRFHMSLISRLCVCELHPCLCRWMQPANARLASALHPLLQIRTLLTPTKNKRMLSPSFMLYWMNWTHTPHLQIIVNNKILGNADPESPKLRNPSSLLHQMIVWLIHTEFHQSWIVDKAVSPLSFPPLLQIRHLSNINLLPAL